MYTWDYFFDDENMPAGQPDDDEFFSFLLFKEFGDSGSADNEMLFCFTVCMY